jgi:hypothetical protein
VVLNRPLVIGRECDGENIADTEVSRQHLRLVPSPTALSAVDLDSRNGTTVNGVPLTGRVALVRGDVVRLGRSEVIVVYTPTGEEEAEQLDHDPTQVIGRAIVAPPPPPPGEVTAPSGVIALADRLLGIDPTGEKDLFPSYTELPTRVRPWVWQAARVGSVAVYLAIIVAMFVRPAAGLFMFFGVVVPLWPILFLVAPGLWRNVCPLAATNQIPRVFGFSRALNPPGWLRERGYLIAVTLFSGLPGRGWPGWTRPGPRWALCSR